MEALRGGAGVRIPAGALAIAISVLAVAGCGSSNHGIKNVTVSTTSAGQGVKVFSAAGMALHFKFPGSFRVIKLARMKREAGKNQHSTQAAVGVGAYDLLVLARFGDAEPMPVTAKTISRRKGNIDHLLSSVFARPMDGTVTAVGGMPALSYPRVPTVGLPVAATTRVITLFVGHDEYELECQATASKLAVIEAACNQMLSTLTVSS